MANRSVAQLSTDLNIDAYQVEWAIQFAGIEPAETVEDVPLYDDDAYTQLLTMFVEMARLARDRPAVGRIGGPLDIPRFADGLRPGSNPFRRR